MKELDILCFITSIFVHELAHMLVADKFRFLSAKGDVSYFSRIAKCFDAVGLLFVPFVSFKLCLVFLSFPLVFGWAKPIRLKHQRSMQDRSKLVLIALAGAAANYLLALTSFILLGVLALFFSMQLWLYTLLHKMIFINITLGTFSLLPFGNLDGSLIGKLLLQDNTLHALRVLVFCLLVVALSCLNFVH